MFGMKKNFVLGLLALTVVACVVDPVVDPSVNSKLSLLADQAVQHVKGLPVMTDEEYHELIDAFPVFGPGGAATNTCGTYRDPFELLCCNNNGFVVCCCYYSPVTYCRCRIIEGGPISAP
jgi:hypothetical protein